MNNNFTTLPTDCYGCHQKDFTGTTNPNHVSAGFPTTCVVCHNTTSWTERNLRSQQDGIPADRRAHHRGLRDLPREQQLHDAADGLLRLPTKDFTGTTNPNHVTSGFPTTCAVCHNTTSWLNATFDHNKTAFPLTGAHTTVACALCHVNNNYTTLPTDCYGCHTKDFTGTTNPNHVSAGFPTTCAVCHNTTSLD